ncbi:MAG: hypothetical protein U0J42_02090 [[Bacteroides] pectinophilus]|nr:hypothetical protein [[Bacteroides] pectinophilus]
MEEKYNYYNDDFVICRASMDDAGLIYDMMMEVHSGLEDKSVLVCGDIDYVRRNIQDTGFALIAYHKESMTMEPAGIFVFEYPGESEDNLGNDIGLTKEELLKVVHMDTVVVRSKFRGGIICKRECLKKANGRLIITDTGILWQRQLRITNQALIHFWEADTE